MDKINPTYWTFKCAVCGEYTSYSGYIEEDTGVCDSCGGALGDIESEEEANESQDS